MIQPPAADPASLIRYEFDQHASIKRHAEASGPQLDNGAYCNGDTVPETSPERQHALIYRTRLCSYSHVRMQLDCKERPY